MKAKYFERWGQPSADLSGHGEFLDLGGAKSDSAGDSVKCVLCPHNCVIADGECGFCATRRNLHGVLYAESYGKVTSLALDPIEKKPLYRFHPRSRIWSVGSHGCNMKCGFCQNSNISQFDYGRGGWGAAWDFIAPESLLRFVELEKETGRESVGIAFTYNEPCLFFEYILDAAPLFRQQGHKVVMVSNGQINPGPLEDLLPLVDAWNVDLKAFSPEFYQRHGGDFETVKRNIKRIAETAHIEVTTLVVPGENDGEEEMEELSAWLAGVSPNIPLHLSRYFPRHKYSKPATEVAGLKRLGDIARQRLGNVYLGNV